MRYELFVMCIALPHFDPLAPSHNSRLAGEYHTQPPASLLRLPAHPDRLPPLPMLTWGVACTVCRLSSY